MLIDLKTDFVKPHKKALGLVVGILLFSFNIAYAQIGISTPTVNSGELIRASDWNKVKLDLETLAAAVGSLQNQTWESSGANTYYDSGNVGIGINNPIGTLHIFADTPTPNAVLLQIGTTDDPDRVRIDEDGDLSIDGKLAIRDSDIYQILGDLELSGEKSLYLSMDWDNNDADTNSIYFGKNSAGAGLNFVELMRLTEAGNLGIGISTPSSKLHVAGGLQIGGDASACVAAKAGGLRYDGGAVERCDGANWDALATTNVSDNLGNHLAERNIDLDGFRLVGEGGTAGIAIDFNGEVGIGTDNPISILDVVSDTTPNLIVRTTAVNGQNAALSITGAQTTSVSADIASIRLINKDSTPFEGARIALRNGDGADSTAEGDLVFLTNTGSGNNLTEKMRILDDGKVGIGTSNPIAQLQVFKNTPVANEVIFQVGTSQDERRFYIDAEGDFYSDGEAFINGGSIKSENAGLTVAAEDNLYLVADWNNNDADNRAIVFGKNGVGGGVGFAELGRVNENGRFGINENNPGNRLHVVENNASDRVVTFENRATTGSPEGLLVLTGQGAGPGANFAVGTGTESSHTKKFVVTNEGRVGIGATSPSALLDISGSGNGGYGVRVIETSASKTNAAYTLEVDSSAHTSNLSTAGALKVSVNSGPALVVDGNGNVGIGTTLPAKALEIYGANKGLHVNVTSSDRSAWLQNTSDGTGELYLFNGSNSNSVYFSGNGNSFINSGNVGIGTNSPAAKLAVSNGGASGIEILPGASAGLSVLQSYNRSGAAYEKLVVDSSEFQFRPSGTILDTNKIVFDISGNVGIGEVSPAAKLHVNGEARLTGVSADGLGKVVCIKADQNLGTCTDAPNASGVCSCS